MAKRKRYACKTAGCRTQRKKFGTAAKASKKISHAETNTVALYKKCMSREMKSRLGGRKRKAGAAKKTKCLKWSKGRTRCQRRAKR